VCWLSLSITDTDYDGSNPVDYVLNFVPFLIHDYSREML